MKDQCYCIQALDWNDIISLASFEINIFTKLEFGKFFALISVFSNASSTVIRSSSVIKSIHIVTKQRLLILNDRLKLKCGHSNI